MTFNFGYALKKVALSEPRFPALNKTLVLTASAIVWLQLPPALLPSQLLVVLLHRLGIKIKLLANVVFPPPPLFYCHR